MWWPSPTDPFYLANTVDNTARQSYYGVTGTPTMKCDGTTAAWTSIQSIIQSRMAVTSPIWLDELINVSVNSITVTMKAVSTVAITNNTVIHAVLLDRYSYLPSSPNGQPHHYHAMLDMAPSGSGQTFTATAGDTMTYTATFPLNPSWSISNLDVACFVQNNTSKEVLQSRCEMVPVNIPGLSYQSYTLQDNGNNDGRAEPGEWPSMFITLSNQPTYQTATNVVGTMTTSDPSLTITTGTVSFPNIPSGGTGTNVNPFRFQVSPSAIPHLSSLHLHVVADPGQTTYDVDIPIYIGWPNVLLVDDDEGSIFETYYQPVLDSLDLSYENWSTSTQGTPSATGVAGYDMIVWFTGFGSTNALTTAEQTFIQTYLNNGGKLFLNGQNIAAVLNTSAPTFLHDVLHANFTIANTTVKILNGVAGNPVGNGFTLNCNPGGTGSGSCTSPDGITVIAPASEAFIYSGLTHRGGLTYEGPAGQKLVFFSFPYEAISGQSSSATRWQVMDAIQDFLMPPSAYPNVNITLTPINPPIQIPAHGGSFNFDASVTNGESSAQTFQVWIMAQLPNLSWYGPALGPLTLTLPPSFTLTRVRTQTVPASAPAGLYTYRGYVGTYNTAKWDSSSFTFTKLATGDGNAVGEWANTGQSFDLKSMEMGQTPAQFELLGAYPNPFNPTTTIRYALAEAGQVELTVYDLSGKVAATLANGWSDAGEHQAIFDGTGLASGIYLYRLQVGALEAGGKMVLMK